MSEPAEAFELHEYGPRVRIHANRWARSALARLGGNGTPLPEVITLVRSIYTGLAQVALGTELPQAVLATPTRMAKSQPEAGFYRGPGLDPDARIVVVDIIRGGILPAQVCFELALQVLPDEQVRLDHLNMSRFADDAGAVAGVDLSGSKVGGSLDGATLLLPDPMGATGSTIQVALEHLLERYGRPRRIVAMPMICTPEFLKTALAASEDLVVHTARLDRGLSPQDVLADPPGRHWDRERGLDEHGYIVPGAGGVGEVLNNSWC